MEKKIIEYKEIDAGNVENYLKLGYEVYGFPYQNCDGNQSGGCQAVVKYEEPTPQETSEESRYFRYICRKEWFKATKDLENILFNVSIISILVLLSFFLFELE